MFSAQENGGLCGGQVKSGYENEVHIYSLHWQWLRDFLMRRNSTSISARSNIEDNANGVPMKLTNVNVLPGSMPSQRTLVLKYKVD